MITQALKAEAKRQAELFDQDEQYMLGVLMWREANGETDSVVMTWPHSDTLIAWLVEQLTAAAQVDRETAMLQWLRRNATAEKEPKAKAAFIEAHNACLQIKNEHTAAQVGEQIAPCDDAEFGTYDQIINDRNATIERCAQRLAERGWIEAADELSKMKDEP